MSEPIPSVPSELPPAPTPGSIEPPAPPPPAQEVRAKEKLGITPGARIAGALLLVNAVLVLLESVLLRAQPGASSGPFNGILPSIIDVVIGVSLLRGDGRYRVWAIVRCALGGLLFSAMSFGKGEVFVGVVQVVLSSSLIALLAGVPGTVRTAIACTGFGLYALVEVIGLAATVTGVNPLAGVAMRMSGDVEGKPAGAVRGVAFPYTLAAPSDRWHLYSDAAAHKQNPLADRWVVRPDADAHLLVIAETLGPGLTIDVEALGRVVLDNARKAATDLQVIEEGPLPGRTGARFMRYSGTIQGMPLEHYAGVYTDGHLALQVLGFAPRAHFAEVEAELKRAIASVELPK